MSRIDRAVDAAARVDLGLLGARDDVARGELHRVRRVRLHEALALAVDQVRALAAAALGQQDPGRVERRRVELHELHVLQRQPRAAAPSPRRRRCTRRRSWSCGRCGPGRRSRASTVLPPTVLQPAVQQIPADDALAAAVVLDELPGEVLLVDGDVALHELLVEHLDQHVAGDVGREHGARRAGGAERPLREPAVVARARRTRPSARAGRCRPAPRA